MGIPFYFKTLITQHPNIIQPSLKTKIKRCAKLFLDYNCILHTCAQHLFMSQKFDKAENAYDQIIQNAIEYTKTIVSHVQPSQLVYIAVDGMCPRAKMVQQRKRRFIGAWKQSILNTKWDSNTITPGTTFMKRFDQEIAEFVKQQDGQNGVQWILSPSSSPGEGEHKIFQFMRAATQNDTTENMIYGLDADLILLSLLHMDKYPKDQIRLLREAMVFNVNANTSPFMQLDVGELYTALTNTYNIPICDYVMLCSLLGNDFIPSLSFLKIKANGIDKVINSYNEVGQPLVSQSAFIDHTTLMRILEIIGRSEDQDMHAAVTAYYDQRPFIDKTKPRVAQEIDNYPLFNKAPPVGTIQPLVKGWRLSYYHVLFGDANHITQICDQYVKGLDWIATYYLNYTHADFNWFYPYNYAPTILDVVNHMRTVTEQVENKKTEQKVTIDKIHLVPLEFQLLCVLPPQSMNLLPDNLKPIMTDVELGCVHYYPTQFTIQTFLKQYLWEAYPNLPTIDYNHLQGVFDRICAIVK